MPTIDQIRAAIKAKIETVANVGVVHDYERFASEAAKFRALYLTGTAPNQRILGWHVRRVATREQYIAVSRWVVDHDWQIRGFMGIDDADATEKTFDALIESIRTAFRDDETLGALVAACLKDETEVISVLDSGPVMLAGTLCHAARLALTTRHYL